MRHSSQKGFTLIELIVVIVILGILAAFAVPKFIGVETEARVASLNALMGSLRSASVMAHGVWMAQNGPANITVDGKTVTMANQYPNASTVTNTQQDLSAYGTTLNGTVRTFTKSGAPNPANCAITYTEATVAANGVVTPPVIALSSRSGC
jgi:MSHA pilin protein MshA